MSHLRRPVTAIVVAVFSLGLVTATASAASADDGAQAGKKKAPAVQTHRDSWWY